MTKLYLQSGASDGVWFGDERVLRLTAGAGLTVASATTGTGPLSDGALGWQTAGTALVWLTPPLDAVTIPAGTVVRFNFWQEESNVLANAGAECYVGRNDNAGAAIADLAAWSRFGTEMPVGTRTAQNWTTTSLSTSILAGERIAIYPAVIDAGGTMAPGHTCTFGFAGTSDSADGDSWIDIEGISITIQGESTSVIYMSNIAGRGAGW